MAFEVLRTPQVRDAVAQMSRTERAGYQAARDELGGRGCVAGGYKLAATDGGDYPVCARHLANAWRMYTAYPDSEDACGQCSPPVGSGGVSPIGEETATGDGHDAVYIGVAGRAR
jgi:hypothetical protein